MMRLISVLLVAAAAPAAALAQQSPYAAAVQARLAGDPDRAIGLLEPVVASDPGNVDARVQLGLAQLARSDFDAAERAFTAALAQAPDYTDAHIGLARVAQRRGDTAGALAALSSVPANNPEAAALRVQLAPRASGPRLRLDVETSHSSLTGPQPDWKEAAAQLRYQAASGAAVTGRVEYARRFGINDVYIEAAVEQRLSDQARAYVSVGTTIDADFRPRWQIGAGGSLRVRGGGNATVLTLDARQSSFANGEVQSVTPGIEQYLGGAAWLTGRWINLFDERGAHRSGYLVRGDLQVVEPVRVFAGYSDAPDTDEGRVVPVRSVFAGISIDVDSATTLRASIAHEDRATGSDRTQFGLGLGLRF
ncbi:YaiO family outer membrane beta-barrel protein [Sphingomonas jeddahensis]|uniref:Tetratricopeptide repeat protein n=1 Tax=Sphingomonas jeddahensis TaxID=1915074 RepID=A0A1V2EXC6_9SPHN|nr:YaiO family outer membrane beta-barrel protein [Sphingomonas jeddahensis]ONF97321.1 tetratricopeptide repeat protein [Sphingomonas jeddahensis]